MNCLNCNKPIPSFAKSLGKKYCSEQCEKSYPKKDIPEFFKKIFKS